MKASILIVDDSPTIRQQLKMTLEKVGHTVTEAPSGEKGLFLARARKFDLIVSDVNMDKMDGLDMIAHIRKIPGYEAIPIFVLTTECTSDMMKRGREVKATSWIVKPFSPAVLLKGVEKVLPK